MMKLYQFTLKLCINLLFTCLFFFNASAHAEQLVIPVSDWPPYIEAKSPDKGFMSNIVIKSFAKAGIDVKLKFMPWKRVEHEINNKNAVSFGWYLNEERAKKWHFSQEIVKGMIVFAARTNTDISWNSFEDLKQYKIGITRSYTGGDEFDRFKSQLHIEEATSDEINLRKLISKRFDLFTVDPVVGAKLLRTKFSPKERKQIKFMTNKPISSLGIHLICSKNNEKCLYYINKFNQGFEAITLDGTKQEIIDQAMSFE